MRSSKHTLPGVPACVSRNITEKILKRFHCRPLAYLQLLSSVRPLQRQFQSINLTPRNFFFLSFSLIFFSYALSFVVCCFDSVRRFIFYEREKREREEEGQEKKIGMSTAAAVCAILAMAVSGSDGDAHFRPRSGTATKTRRCRFCSSRNVVLLLQLRNTLLQCSACEQLPSSIRKNDDEKTKRGVGEGREKKRLAGTNRRPHFP